jgi:HEAT repeat protein
MGARAAAAGGELVAAMDEPRTAPAAAAALGAIGHVAACERLEQALAASDVELSCAAARALGKLAQARSIPALRAAFAADLSDDVRQAAAESLLALDAVEVLPYLAQRMTAERAETVAAEAAVDAWLARGAARGEPGASERLERWRALDPIATGPPGAIATREQLAARQLARAALARSW